MRSGGLKPPDVQPSLFVLLAVVGHCKWRSVSPLLPRLMDCEETAGRNAMGARKVLSCTRAEITATHRYRRQALSSLRSASRWPCCKGESPHGNLLPAMLPQLVVWLPEVPLERF